MSNAPFVASFNAVQKEVEYNPKWENGTGYLDHAVKGDHAPELLCGEMAKSVSTKGRRIVLIGTRFGNIVLFDRYSDPESKAVVSNMPNQITTLLRGSLVGTNLSTDDVTLPLLLGDPTNQRFNPNIGARIEQVFG